MRRNIVAWAALVVSVAALIGSQGYSRLVPASQDLPVEGQQVAKALSDAFNAVADYVAPSVVQINVEKKVTGGMGRGRGDAEEGETPEIPQEMEEMLKKFFGNNPQFEFRRNQFSPQQFVNEGTGSGFVFDDKGHILTNAHVVSGADRITVVFHDGTEAKATVVGTNAETDVAVIKVESGQFPAVKIGDSESLKVGQWVLALGSPFGLDHTVTAGIVSATNRQGLGINRFESFIQTDAAINLGNSGGPLVDLYGNVVGINAAIATPTRSNAGIGFAIPINMAARIANKLIADGKIEPALIGINIDPVTPALARQLGIPEATKGLLVTDVGKDTPAEKAGLKIGDVILSFDAQPVTSRQTLQYLVSTSDIGQSYIVRYLRDGEEREVNVSPARFEAVAAMMGSMPGEALPGDLSEEAPQGGQFSDFGFSVAPLSEELSKKHDWPKDSEGLIVTEVDPDGPAGQSGLEVGDRVTRVIANKEITPVDSLAEFKKAVGKNDTISIYVEDVRKQLPGQFMTLDRQTEPATVK